MLSLGLPWAPALAITGFKPCPPSTSRRAAHFSLSSASTLVPRVFPSPGGEPDQGLCQEQLGVSDRASRGGACKELSRPLVLLSLAPSFPQSGSLQLSLFLLPRILRPSQDALGHSPCSARTHPTPPQGESQLHLILPCAHLARSQVVSMTEAFPTLGICCLLPPLLFPLVLWGEGKNRGARPAAWGPQGDVG